MPVQQKWSFTWISFRRSAYASNRRFNTLLRRWHQTYRQLGIRGFARAKDCWVTKMTDNGGCIFWCKRWVSVGEKIKISLLPKWPLCNFFLQKWLFCLPKINSRPGRGGCKSTINIWQKMVDVSGWPILKNWVTNLNNDGWLFRPLQMLWVTYVTHDTHGGEASACYV